MLEPLKVPYERDGYVSPGSSIHRKRWNTARPPRRPGEASFHNGWTLHASMPNGSDARRIGLNVQYLATDVRQTQQETDSALLVRGKDDF